MFQLGNTGRGQWAEMKADILRSDFSHCQNMYMINTGIVGFEVLMFLKYEGGF